MGTYWPATGYIVAMPDLKIEVIPSMLISEEVTP